MPSNCSAFTLPLTPPCSAQCTSLAMPSILPTMGPLRLQPNAMATPSRSTACIQLPSMRPRGFCHNQSSRTTEQHLRQASGQISCSLQSICSLPCGMQWTSTTISGGPCSHAVWTSARNTAVCSMQPCGVFWKARASMETCLRRSRICTRMLSWRSGWMAGLERPVMQALASSKPAL